MSEIRHHVLRFDRFTVDLTRGCLQVSGRDVALPPKPFEVLRYLAENAGRLVPKDELCKAVWPNVFVSDDSLVQCIRELRSKLGDGNRRLIKTFHRRGYLLDAVTTDTISESADVIAEPGAGTDDRRDTRALIENPGERSGTRNSAEEETAIGRPSELHGRPAVAVLPFNNMSGDPEQEYFSDGSTEDIMTALAKHRSLLLIARSSTFSFKGHDSDVRRIGQNLGADYVVEGSVRKVGNDLRVTVHLIETEEGRLIWTDRYDRPLEEIFDVQDEITTSIAASIEPGVGTAERLRAQRKPPAALHAWDFFHLATRQFYRFRREANIEAQKLLRQAIELDLTHAQAHAFLSYSIVLGMLYFDVDSDDERLDESVALSRKAVELDQQDAHIRFIYGRVLLARRAYPDAVAELETALELNPGSPAVYCGLGDSLACEGRFDEAFFYFRKAIDLSPHDPQRWAYYSHRSLAHLFTQEFDEALHWAQKATRMPNCHYWPFVHQVSALGHLRLQPQLHAAVTDLQRQKPDLSCSLARKRLFYVKDRAHLDIYIDGLRAAGIPE